jgi:hypothetical protein
MRSEVGDSVAGSLVRWPWRGKMASHAWSLARRRFPNLTPLANDVTGIMTNPFFPFLFSSIIALSPAYSTRTPVE